MDMPILARVTASAKPEPDRPTWTIGATAAFSFARRLSTISTRSPSSNRESFPEDQVSRRSLSQFLRAPHRPVIAAPWRRTRQAMRSCRCARARGPRAFIRSRLTPVLRAGEWAWRCCRPCEKYARLHGRVALTLEVRYDNAPAIALYEKWGFRQFGEHEDYYADGAMALRYRKILFDRPPLDRDQPRRRARDATALDST